MGFNKSDGRFRHASNFSCKTGVNPFGHNFCLLIVLRSFLAIPVLRLPCFIQGGGEGRKTFLGPLQNGEKRSIKAGAQQKRDTQTQKYIRGSREFPNEVPT